MRKAVSWFLNLMGWALDGRELATIAGVAIVGSGGISVMLEFIRSLPIPILITIIIGIAILLFVGFSYLLDCVKKKRIGNGKVGKEGHIYASDEAVVSYKQSGGQTARIITNVQSQSEYVQPNKAIKQKVHELFAGLLMGNEKVTFLLEVEAGNNMRHKVAHDLEEMVNNPEMVKYPKGNTYMGRFPNHPITLITHPSHVEMLKALAESLKVYLVSEWNFLPDDTFSNNYVKIYINGTPRFNMDGQVTIM